MNSRNQPVRETTPEPDPVEAREIEIGNDLHEWFLRQYPDFDDDTSGEDSADITDHLKMLFRRALSHESALREQVQALIEWATEQADVFSQTASASLGAHKHTLGRRAADHRLFASKLAALLAAPKEQ